MLNFLNIVNIITIFLLYFFSVFLLTYNKKGNKISHKILAVFFITQASCIFNTYCWEFYSYTSVHCPYLFYIGDTILFLWGPSLYFYVYSMTSNRFKLKFKHLIHLLPLTVHFVYMIFRFHRFGNEVKRGMLASGVISKVEYHMVYIIFHALILIYMIAAFIELSRYKKKIKMIYSNTDKINYNWVRFILFGFVFIWILDVSDFTLDFFIKTPKFIINSVYPIVFILANIIVYRALRQPEVIIKMESNQKYSQSTLSKIEKDKYVRELIHLMDSEKLYKTPSLTINDLSDKLMIHSKQLSQIINECLEQNFFDFINSYRIKEACKMLEADLESKVTILEILYEVGYNTKSAFNKAFLKYNNITPTEYRNNLMNSN